MTKSKVLVTGGAGFIASHIVDKYIDNGHEVVVVDNLSTGNEKNINKKARFYNVDIRDSKLESIFSKEKPDYVNHHAAQMDVRRSVADPLFDADINILGTLNILQNCVKHKVKKISFASSGGAAYGEQDVFPAPETHIMMPVSPYGITKLVAEHYLYFYKKTYGLNYVALRYANVYGPRQDPFGEAGVVSIFINKLLKNEQPVIYGDGKQTRDFVYVGDVVRANMLAMNSYESETAYNVGTGKETSINNLFQLLKEAMDSSVVEKHESPKLGEQARSVLLCDKARDVLGWQPAISIGDGLRKTVEYFRLIK